MCALNPYEKFLDGSPVEEILATTPEALTAALESIGAEKLTLTYAPCKWCAAEITCHLADLELIFGFILRQTLTEDNPIIQKFDQDKWAATYTGIPASQALSVFTALRQWNLTLIRTALPAAAARPTTHLVLGEMTFQTIVEIMAGHDLNHLDQLHRIAGQFA
jgi:DinB superfamily